MAQATKRSLLLMAALAVAVCGRQHAVIGAPNAEQVARSKTATAQIRKAGVLYRAKRTKDSAEALREAQATLAELIATGDPREARALAAPIRANLEKAQQLLKQQGETFDPLPSLPDATAATAAPQNTSPANAAGGVSFVTQIAPMLVAKCGGCHVNQSRGGLSLATFAAIQKGSPEGGIIVQPGSSQGSRIVEVIESGDMPRGGGRVSAEQLALLRKWIDEGAKFDGADANAPIARLAPAQPSMPAAQMPKVAQATGKESILFARDVGPAIVANCLGCHGTNNPRAQLSLATFNDFLKGGDSGEILIPGKPADSLLVQKLKGTAGARMPLNRPPLSAETIAKIEKWITEGAKFDGPDPAMQTEDVVRLLFASRSTHEELAAARQKSALKTWKLTLPDAEANTHESDNFLVVGNLAEELIADVAQTADTLAPRIGKMLGSPAGKPLIKGRLTIFAFAKRYDYGEIGTMVENRELPAGTRGHWRYTGIDAYACIVPPKPGEDQPLDSLLAQQIAGAYVASLGQVPHWFAEGSGRLVASRINPKDPRFKTWEKRLPEIMSLANKGSAVVNGQLPGEDGDIAAFGLVKALAAKGGKYGALLNALRAGQPFDAAFAVTFGGSPVQVADAWTSAKSGSKPYR